MKKFFLFLILIVVTITLASGFEPTKSIRLDWENDSFFGSPDPTDRFYTNGLQLIYGRSLPGSSSVAKLFSNILFFLDPLVEYNSNQTVSESYLPKADLVNSDVKGESEDTLISRIKRNERFSTEMYFSVAQNMYTPTDLSSYQPLVDDRPYAGWSRFGLELRQTDIVAFSTVLFGISLGSLGDSGSGTTQTMVHALTDATMPQGWDNHIENRIAFQIHFGKGSEIFQYGKLSWVSGYQHWRIDAGNVFIRGTSGLTLKAGLWHIPYPFPMLPQLESIIKANRMNHYNLESRKPFWGGLNIFGGVSLTASAYNGTLDARTGIAYRVSETPLFIEASAGFEATLFHDHIYIRFAPYNYRSLDFLINYTLPTTMKEFFYHNWGQISFLFKIPS